MASGVDALVNQQLCLDAQCEQDCAPEWCLFNLDALARTVLLEANLEYCALEEQAKAAESVPLVSSPMHLTPPSSPGTCFSFGVAPSSPCRGGVARSTSNSSSASGSFSNVVTRCERELLRVPAFSAAASVATRANGVANVAANHEAVPSVAAATSRTDDSAAAEALESMNQEYAAFEALLLSPVAAPLAASRSSSTTTATTTTASFSLSPVRLASSESELLLARLEADNEEYARLLESSLASSDSVPLLAAGPAPHDDDDDDDALRALIEQDNAEFAALLSQTVKTDAQPLLSDPIAFALMQDNAEFQAVLSETLNADAQPLLSDPVAYALMQDNAEFAALLSQTVGGDAQPLLSDPLAYALMQDNAEFQAALEAAVSSAESVPLLSWSPQSASAAADRQFFLDMQAEYDAAMTAAAASSVPLLSKMPVPAVSVPVAEPVVPPVAAAAAAAAVASSGLGNKPRRRAAQKDTSRSAASLLTNDEPHLNDNFSQVAMRLRFYRMHHGAGSVGAFLPPLSMLAS